MAISKDPRHFFKYSDRKSKTIRMFSPPWDNVVLAAGTQIGLFLLGLILIPVALILL